MFDWSYNFGPVRKYALIIAFYIGLLENYVLDLP